MTFNWYPIRPVFLDFETRSHADLKEVGSRKYLTDPTTEILSLVLRVDGGNYYYAPHCPYETTLDAVRLDDEGLRGLIRSLEGRTLVAHNAEGFDAIAWRELIGGPEFEWYDTLPCARAAGLPGSLDALGEVLVGRGKPEVGHKAVLLLGKPNRKGAYPCGTVHTWQELLAYNLDDVLKLETVFHATEDAGEPDVLAAHIAVNNRGIAIDRAFAGRLDRIWHDLEKRAIDDVTRLTEGKLNGSSLRSGKEVHKWLATHGVKLDTLDRKELELFYDDPAEYLGEADLDTLPLVVEVLKLRQRATRIGKSKIKRILDAADEADDRVRRILRYWGAHTGRWAGAGVQPQNFTRGVDIDVESLVADSDLSLDVIDRVRGPHSLDDALSTLTRPVFCAAPGNRLLIVDYAAVEARGIAWLAGQEDMLGLFLRGQDVYLDMGGVIFGRGITKADKTERQISKIVVLGSGYGMSAGKLAAFCRVQGVDLAAAGTSAEACITAYRTKNDRIVKLWRNYGDAALNAVRRGHDIVGRVEFSHDGRDLRITLPSGRDLVYRGAVVADRVPKYVKVLGLPEHAKPTVCYRHPRGYEGQLYGGLIAENVTQAVCRDLLATALVRCETEGLPVVLHVHDEIVAEVPEADAERGLRRLAEIMTDSPPWADGFPISVEGFDCTRYTKSPFRDSRKVHL